MEIIKKTAGVRDKVLGNIWKWIKQKKYKVVLQKLNGILETKMWI